MTRQPALSTVEGTPEAFCLGPLPIGMTPSRLLFSFSVLAKAPAVACTESVAVCIAPWNSPFSFWPIVESGYVDGSDDCTVLSLVVTFSGGAVAQHFGGVAVAEDGGLVKHIGHVI
ncbi:hypothetical protein TruAng_003810 [Truncatella angustata]|nr:hypothetical protein TruAng_003810 [Truncatella angustata]